MRIPGKQTGMAGGAATPKSQSSQTHISHTVKGFLLAGQRADLAAWAHRGLAKRFRRALECPAMASIQAESGRNEFTIRPPLAFLPLFVGKRPGMGFSELSRLAAHNAGAWLMLLFGGFFVVLHGLQGSTELVAMNLAFVSVGATSLWLAARGFFRTSLVVLSLGAGVVFFGGALAFHNGMENYLLVIMAASFFLLDTAATRALIGGLNAAGFFYVKLRLAEAGLETSLSPARYGTNILLFLLTLAGIIEFFRVLNSDYLRSLEEKNAALEEANRAKERLFSIVAHDLRGPIGNLQTSLELLESGTLSDEEFRGLITDLAADIEKSHSVVENILSWSATQLQGLTIEPQAHLLRHLIAEGEKACSLAARRKRIEIINSVSSEARVHTDGAKMQVVFRNLLTNAVKFTPPSGQVRITAQREGAFWITVIADTGVGMEPEEAAALYSGERPTVSTPGTASEKGLGLGSEICREYVRRCGGSIHAESRPGEGMRVFVALPAAG